MPIYITTRQFQASTWSHVFTLSIYFLLHLSFSHRPWKFVFPPNSNNPPISYFCPINLIPLPTLILNLCSYLIAPPVAMVAEVSAEAAVVALRLKAATSWWDIVNHSAAWQDRIFLVLAVLYGIVAAVALVIILPFVVCFKKKCWFDLDLQ